MSLISLYPVSCTFVKNKINEMDVDVMLNQDV